MDYAERMIEVFMGDPDIDGFEIGPVYGVRLISSMKLPGDSCEMLQAMPSRNDLEEVRVVSERTAAGYEVLLQHYRNQLDKMRRLEQNWQDGHAVQEMRHKEEVSRLTGLIRNVIDGNWCATELQEAIGDV